MAALTQKARLTYAIDFRTTLRLDRIRLGVFLAIWLRGVLVGLVEVTLSLFQQRRVLPHLVVFARSELSLKVNVVAPEDFKCVLLAF